VHGYSPPPQETWGKQSKGANSAVQSAYSSAADAECQAGNAAQAVRFFRNLHEPHWPRATASSTGNDSTILRVLAKQCKPFWPFILGHQIPLQGDYFLATAWPLGIDHANKNLQ
jgi:hypothetical protein